MKHKSSCGQLIDYLIDYLTDWLFDYREAELWHPDSPGSKVRVVRSRFGRLIKPVCFATITETLKSGIVWKKIEEE